MPVVKKVILRLMVIAAFLPACKKAPTKLETAESLIIPADFLSDSKFKSLTIDLVYDEGHPPATETINTVKKFLADRLNKSNGIKIILKEIKSNTKSVLSLADISSIENANRSYYSKESGLACFVYLANSDYSENAGSAKILGIAYGSTAIVLFGKTMNEFSGGLGKPAYHVLESAVAEHEFGHIMGLVNNGTSMVTAHMDAAHGKHCNSTDCLMYYLSETSDIFSNLLGGNIPVLDSNCIKDLRRNGGK